MTEYNHQWTLQERPVGYTSPKNWRYESQSIPDPQEGQVLLKTIYISIDPAMRGWINEGKSYIEPVGLGEVMRAGTLSQVVESRHPDYQSGDLVYGMEGVQQYSVNPGSGLFKIDPSVGPLTQYLGALGMPGMTAYFGLLKTGDPKPGETVLVSGAAGAVGSLVGQIAKIKGCHVVGIAGGPEKCQYLKDECNFDGAIDYKNSSVKDGLKELCPNGVDVFFDNVGGDILDTALTRINRKARIVICGAISQYNNTTPIKGPSNYLSLLVNRAKMEGIVVFDNAKDYGKAATEIAAWMQSGQIKAKEHVVQGIENFPDSLNMLFEGKNFGKLILQVGEVRS